MRYYLDGYNVLFRFRATPRPLELHREQLLDELGARVAAAKLHIIVVFDAAKVPGPYQRSHRGALEIIYTDEGESADAYILSELATRHAATCTLVSDDNRLALRARELGGRTLSIDAFFEFLNRRLAKGSSSARATPPDWDPAHPEFQRWVEAFEKRLEDNDKDS